MNEITNRKLAEFDKTVSIYREENEERIERLRTFLESSIKEAYEAGRKASCIPGHCEHSKVLICLKCFKERN